MMSGDPVACDVFLNPGEFFWGRAGTRIRTLLGSCVAITLWSPRYHEGGMCHIMLPGSGRVPNPRALDGRYAPDAVELFKREMRRLGETGDHFVAKLFGGGSMFGAGTAHETDGNAMANVAHKNIRATKLLLHENGIKIQREHIAGTQSRQIVFEVASGDVWLKQNKNWSSNMYVEWNDSYKIGISVIDRQHQQLFVLINQLYDIVSNGEANSSDDFAKVFEGFVRYANEHFASEERVMKASGMPTAMMTDHIKEHEDYRRRIQAIHKAIRDGDKHVRVQLMSWLGNWWGEHVVKRDQKLKKATW